MKINFRRDPQKRVLLGCSILTVSLIVVFLSACVVTAERDPYYGHEPGPRTAKLHSIEGLWFITASNYSGRLEFR